jgi:hypothetical protein
MTFRPQHFLLGGHFPHRRGFAGRTALLDDLDNRETMAIKLVFILIPPPSIRVECCWIERLESRFKADGPFLPWIRDIVNRPVESVSDLFERARFGLRGRAGKTAGIGADGEAPFTQSCERPLRVGLFWRTRP